MLFYACFAVINGLFCPVGQFVPRTSLSLRHAARGYNPNGQFAPRLGHSRENKSQNKCADYYYPKRERKNTTVASAQVV